MSDVDLSGYEITLRKDRIFGWWTWKATTPDGVVLSDPFASPCLVKENAERRALQAIRADAKTEVLSGDALARRCAERPEVTS